MSKKKIFYHHGPVATPAIAAALKEIDTKVPCRNADYFDQSGTEDCTHVVVDEGKNTEAIKKAYAAKDIPVEVVTGEEAPKAPKEPKTPKAPKAALDPDAARQPAATGKAQGKAPETVA